jgi:uncharacterized protein YndB with AHSA1/START domain
MKNLKKIAVGILGIMAIMMIISIYLPSEIRLEKAVVIDAPREQVFQQVSDPRNWTDWTVPQETTLQPDGHFFRNRDGEFTVISRSPFEIVEARMKMCGIPNIRSTFNFQGNDKTMVSWNLRADLGKSPYRKYQGLLIRRAIVPEMEMSLGNLKNLLESITR